MIFKFKLIDTDFGLAKYRCEYCNYQIDVCVRAHITQNEEILKEYLLHEVYKHIVVEIND